MEEKMNGKKCECGCGWCSCSMGYHHALFRVVLGVLILLVVFYIGVKIGELKGMIEGSYGGYGYPMMGGYDGYMHRPVFLPQPGSPPTAPTGY